MGRRDLHVIFLLLLALAVSGCPSFWKSGTKQEAPTAQELFKKAEALYSKKDYRDAIELYERVKIDYPEFEERPQVYLRIADAYFKLGEYEDAISRYDQFIEQYPAHEEVARAKYMQGMSYFDRIGSIDRDNRYVKSATQAFERVIADAPDGEWKDKAKEKLRQSRKKLGEKELYKARTYVKLDNYKAARHAAQRVLDQYSGLGLDKEAKEIIESVKGK